MPCIPNKAINFSGFIDKHFDIHFAFLEHNYSEVLNVRCHTYLWTTWSQHCCWCFFRKAWDNNNRFDQVVNRIAHRCIVKKRSLKSKIKKKIKENSYSNSNTLLNNWHHSVSLFPISLDYISSWCSWPNSFVFGSDNFGD